MEDCYTLCHCEDWRSPFSELVRKYEDEGQTFAEAKNSAGKDMGWNTLEDE